MEEVYAVGQRWISEAEPDLGLGTVLELAKGRVQILFPASEELRTYAAANAPLKRVRFKVGDKITTQDDITVVIDAVVEDEHLITYHAAKQVIPEALLNDAISFHTAEERLLSGQIDEPKLFQLRRKTAKFRYLQQSSNIRGFVGGRIDLIPHQLYIAHEVSNRYAPRVLLSDEVGLGKTIEACLILHRMLLNGQAQRVLVAVPDSLVHQWFVEMLRRFNIWLNIYDEERCEAIESSAPDNNPFLDDQLILCSIDFLAGSEKRAKQAVAAGWDIMVVDEAHHLAWSPEKVSSEYALVEALGLVSKGMLLLTATPEQLGIESHFARLRLLDPDRYNNFESFKLESNDFRIIASIIDNIEANKPLSKGEKAFIRKRMNGQETPVLQRLERIQADASVTTEDKQVIIDQLLDLHGPGRVLFRNTRANMTGFPARIAHLTPLTSTKEHKSWLQRAVKEFAFDTNHNKNQQAYHFQDDPRLDWLVQFLQKNSNEKVLLICRSQKKALALHEAFRDRVNISAGIFHESLSLVQRDRNAAWFAEEHGARLLICSEIGSEGRNFQFAHHLVLFDLPLNPELLEQRIGRLDRIGQTEDIHIHVPFLKHSPQEILAHWYHKGLNAFEKNMIGTNAKIDALGEEIYALARTLTGTTESLQDAAVDQLIESTRMARQALEAELQEGRNRLIERNSFRPAVAQSIVEAIGVEDRDVELENYLLQVFEYAGIQVEEHAPRTYYLNPQGITIDAFPAIPQEGLTITFDRKRALSREEIDFLSWDHPIATGAMDVIAGSEKGNSSFAVIVDEEQPDILLEAIFLLETVSAQATQVNRFSPTQPVSVIVNRSAEDLTDQFEAMQADILRKGNADRLLSNSLVTQQLIPAMLDHATEIAEAKVAEIKNTQLAKITTMLDIEIDRLKSLQQLNGNVRDAEIELAVQEKVLLSDAIKNARLRLDALRLIWQGPEGMVTGS